jgi:hypothetical protein
MMLLVTVAVFSAGQVLHRKLFGRRAKVKRVLRRLPLGRGKAAGFVRVTGRVRPTGALFQAPLTGRPCVAYHLLVQQESEEWFTCLEERNARPFNVGDERGQVLVDAGDSFILSLASDKLGATGAFDSHPTHERGLFDLLDARGMVTSNWYGRWKAFWYCESVLQEGDTVSVGGLGAREVRPEGDRAGLRESPELLVIRGTAEAPLVISDEENPNDPSGSP